MFKVKDTRTTSVLMSRDNFIFNFVKYAELTIRARERHHRTTSLTYTLSSDDTIADFKQVNNGWLITVSGFKLGLESYYL